MNDATKEFVAYVDSDEGKAEIAQKDAEFVPQRMAEMEHLGRGSVAGKTRSIPRSRRHWSVQRQRCQ